VFKRVVSVTVLFSIPDFLGSVGLGDHISPFTTWIPFNDYQLGWVLPSLVALLISNLVHGKKQA